MVATGTPPTTAPASSIEDGTAPADGPSLRDAFWAALGRGDRAICTDLVRRIRPPSVVQSEFTFDEDDGFDRISSSVDEQG